MARYSMDIESYVNYFLVFWRNLDNGEQQVFELWRKSDNCNRLRKFMDGLSQDDEVFTYNGIGYDFILLERIRDEFFDEKQHGQDVAREIWNYAQAHIFRKRAEGEFRMRANIFSFPFTCIDLMELWNLGNPKNRIPLKKLAANLRYPNILDLPHPPDTELTLAQKKEVLAYCRNDVEMTGFLADKAAAEISLRRWLSKKYNVDVVTKGEPRVGSAIMSSLWESEKGDKPPRQTEHPLEVDFKDILNPKINFKDLDLDCLLEDALGFTRMLSQGAHSFSENVEFRGNEYTVAEGGIHDKIGARVYKASENLLLADIDVSSFYPFLMLEHNCMPRHLPDMGRMFRSLVDDRLRYKAEGAKLEAKALKICINALYGMMGNKYSYMFDPVRKLKVCMNGQFYQLMLMDRLALFGIETIYANTDGIVAAIHPDQKSDLQKVVNAWSDKFRFALDIEYWDAMYCLNVNDYFWVKGDHIKRKKSFATEGGIGVGGMLKAPVISRAVIEHFTKCTPVEETITGEQDIYEFCYVAGGSQKMTNHMDLWGGQGLKLPKTLRYYHAHDGGELYKISSNTGSRIRYPDAKCVAMMLSPNPKAIYNVNHEYYINQANEIIAKLQAVENAQRLPA